MTNPIQHPPIHERRDVEPNQDRDRPPLTTLPPGDAVYGSVLPPVRQNSPTIDARR